MVEGGKGVEMRGQSRRKVKGAEEGKTRSRPRNALKAGEIMNTYNKCFLERVQGNGATRGAKRARGEQSSSFPVGLPRHQAQSLQLALAEQCTRERLRQKEGARESVRSSQAEDGEAGRRGRRQLGLVKATPLFRALSSHQASAPPCCGSLMAHKDKESNATLKATEEKEDAMDLEVDFLALPPSPRPLLLTVLF